MMSIAPFLRRARLALLAGLALMLATLFHLVPVQAQVPYQLPMLGSNRGTPMVMINLSKDHQLSYRAYVEYSDLDGDGALETTYKHSIDYYGYFDAFQCYTYSGGVFIPSGYNTDKYCSGKWSGNFLNWATMTRLDIVRRILYGGMRSTDNSSTVLERAYLPTDAHSFAKYYTGLDIARLTPFTGVSELTMCNTTLGSGSGSDRASHTNRQPPLMRVAAGNFQLWNSNERWQCYWLEEKSAGWGASSADVSLTGLGAWWRNPNRSSGLNVGADGPDFIVRVQACTGADDPPSSQPTNETCRKYPRGNRKPAGLLHRFGEENQMLFGLFTGTFERNTSGGVLRSNIASIRDEINYDTDGSFRTDVAGIVRNIDKIRIYGYDYNDGTYIGYDNNCTYQLIGLSDGRCRSWGNPMTEIYTESLRYFAGRSPTAAFQVSGGADATLGLAAPSWKDPFRSGSDRLPGVNACSAMHQMVFNASVSSWDYPPQIDITSMGAATGTVASTNLIGSLESVAGTARPIGAIAGATDGTCTPKSVSALGDANGLCPEAPTQKGGYGIAGAAWWAHTNRIRSDVTAPPDSDNVKPLRVNTIGVAMATNTPSIKIPIPGRSDSVTIQPFYLLDLGGSGKGNGTLVDFRVVYQDVVNGQGRFFVNWEDSEQGGDYDMDAAGYIKYWFSADRTKLYVETLVTAYASGNPQGFGYVIDGVRENGPHFHSGAANFTYSSATATSMNVYRPVAGTSGNRVSTLNPARINGVSGSLIGTTGGCVNCVQSQSGGLPTVAEYTVTGTSAAELPNPLWFAAKWGGFKDKDGDNKPLLLGEWAERNRNLPPYRGMSDAEAARSVAPDNYFYVANPGQLPAALTQALTLVNGDQSLSGLDVTTRTIRTGGTLTPSAYSATFLPDWSGDLRRYTIDPSGTAALAAKASSAFSSLSADRSRRVLTTTSAGPGLFTWAALPATDRAIFSVDPVTGRTDTLGQTRVDWVRGSGADEQAQGGVLRNRSVRLGDIVNSTPHFIGAPRATIAVRAGDGYAAFRSANAGRTPMVYVGGNDGMLHGFDATTLQEVFAYVPNAIYKKLPALADPEYLHQYLVDGSPFSADVKVGGTWRTLLFGSLGAGGQSLYSLDVTSPSSIASSTPSSIVRWEFDDRVDRDLGYVLGEVSDQIDGQPNQVVTLPDGERYLLFGNGVASDAADSSVGDGDAALFIVRAAGPRGAAWQLGVDYFKIKVGRPGGNGLAMPFAVDRDGDGVADVAYAGDLKGNLWRFEFPSGTSSSQWKVSFGGLPLYVARSSSGAVQPITSAPIAANLSSALGGTFVAFGTGRYYLLSDSTDSTPQSIYGVWDGPSTGAVSGRSSLVAQTLRSTSAAGFRDLSSNAVCLKSTQTGCGGGATLARGWYVDLDSGGERVLFNPSIDAGADLVVTSTAPGDFNACDTNGATWFNRMRLLSGGSIGKQMFDTNRDRVVDSSDTINSSARVSGIRKSLVVLQPEACSGPACQPPPCMATQSSNTGAVEFAATRCSSAAVGRLNWRELVR